VKLTSDILLRWSLWAGFFQLVGTALIVYGLRFTSDTGSSSSRDGHRLRAQTSRFIGRGPRIRRPGPVLRSFSSLRSGVVRRFQRDSQSSSRIIAVTRAMNRNAGPRCRGGQIVPSVSRPIREKATGRYVDASTVYSYLEAA
jgi:hypothetical protein